MRLVHEPPNTTLDKRDTLSVLHRTMHWKPYGFHPKKLTSLAETERVKELVTNTLGCLQKNNTPSERHQ
jgi:hypothetical protein